MMENFGPFSEAAGPASIENFLYGAERAKGESLASYMAAKETALQQMQAQVGERIPPRIAGRILLRRANLETAVKYNPWLTFDQAAAALQPLDRPDALVQKVSQTFYGAGLAEGAEADEEELQPIVSTRDRRKDRRSSLCMPLEQKGCPFKKSQAYASYSFKDKCMYVSKAKASFYKLSEKGRLKPLPSEVLVSDMCAGSLGNAEEARRHSSCMCDGHLECQPALAHPHRPLTQATLSCTTLCDGNAPFPPEGAIACSCQTSAAAAM